jgi:hypothetical protein
VQGKKGPQGRVVGNSHHDFPVRGFGEAAPREGA